jgi:hypothetical protein
MTVAERYSLLNKPAKKEQQTNKWQRRKQSAFVRLSLSRPHRTRSRQKGSNRQGLGTSASIISLILTASADVKLHTFAYIAEATTIEPLTRPLVWPMHVRPLLVPKHMRDLCRCIQSFVEKCLGDSCERRTVSMEKRSLDATVSKRTPS